MQFSDMLALIDKQLAKEERLRDYLSESDPESGVWSRGTNAAEVHPSTSTGILLQLATKGQVIHERIFAASEMSVSRIARAITEHLTGYAA
jgi:hypothetical protein